jgi:hypothetical protein
MWRSQFRLPALKLVIHPACKLAADSLHISALPRHKFLADLSSPVCHSSLPPYLFSSLCQTRLTDRNSKRLMAVRKERERERKIERENLPLEVCLLLICLHRCLSDQNAASTASVYFVAASASGSTWRLSQSKS